MKKIIIIGAGGFAREVKWLIEEINKVSLQYKFLGFLISDLQNLKDTDSKELVLGDFSWLDRFNENIYVAIGIGNPLNRLKVGEQLSRKKKI